MKQSIKILGVGNAGVRILEQLPRAELADVNLAAVNAEPGTLASSTAPERIELDKQLLSGLGSGWAGASDVQVAAVRECSEGVQVVIVIAGLGGRTGTQVSAAIAKAAKDAGACVLAFVTLPFDCEGSLRFSAARHGLAQLQTLADAVFPLPNQEVCSLIDEATNLTDAFNASSQLLVNTVVNVCRALNSSNVMGMEFSDLCSLTWQLGRECAFGSAEARGSDRARAVVEKLLATPMLDGGRTLAGAETVMISVVGGSDLRVSEVNQIMRLVGEHCQGAPMVMGAGLCQGLTDLAVVVAVAPQGGRARSRAEEPTAVVDYEEVAKTARFETHFLSPGQSPRPESRFVPPPPSLTQQEREQILTRQAASGRGRKTPLRLRQGHLNLEIISKGRFDKTEPTVHKGEDLDVPTYIRRGVAMN